MFIQSTALPATHITFIHHHPVRRGVGKTSLLPCTSSLRNRNRANPRNRIVKQIRLSIGSDSESFDSDVDSKPSSLSVPPLSSLCTTLALSLSLSMITCSVNPAIIYAKNLLTENTIYRRYLISDSSTILRYSLVLPSERINDPQPAAIRLIQESLEKLSVHLKNTGGVASLIASRNDLSDVKKTLIEHQLDVLLDVPARNRQVAAESLTKLEQCVDQLIAQIGDDRPVIGESFLPSQAIRAQQTLRDAFTPRNSLKAIVNYDVDFVNSLQKEALEHVSEIEELAVQGSGPAFRIPRRYNDLPRLLGRAHVELEIEKSNGTFQTSNPTASVIEVSTNATKPKNLNTDPGTSPTKRAKIVVTVDGYSAPLTGGNFIDLVTKNSYNGMRVETGQRNFYSQFGILPTQQAQSSQGKQKQELPLEILVNGEPSPIYGSTLDELGIADLSPTLPMTGYGALAMVHSVENPNDASAPFYIFTLDPNVGTVGGSILTGSIATFGYVTEGANVLGQLERGDRIVAAKVLDGMENFQSHGDR